MTLNEASVRKEITRSSFVYLLVSLIATQVPLFNSLGFEFSFLVAVIGSLLAGIGTMRYVLRMYRAPDPPDGLYRATMRAFGRSVALHEALLLLPLLVITVNALVVRNCSYMEGLAFYLLLPVASVWCGAALGFFCAVHYCHARSMFILLAGASVVYALGLGYFTPAIFSYNFFYGYFPGLTYDEVLTPDLHLLFFRLITLGVGGVLVWMGALLVRSAPPDATVRQKGLALLRALWAPRRRLVTAGIAAAACLLYLFRCECGFESTDGYIRRTLGGVVRTEHFDIFYSPLSVSAEDAGRLGLDHEFRLRQVMSAFALQEQERIASYVYPSAAVKMRLIGAGNTNIAKPWSNAVHITQGSVEGTLKHEIVHVVAGRFGVPVIRASTSTGLVEGVAVAVEWVWGTRTPHEYAAGLVRAGLAPPLGSILSFTGFASHTSSLSYVLAGSFCRYMIDRFGVRKMVQVYRTTDYERVYGRSLDLLIADWTNFLAERVPLDPYIDEGCDALFRRPPLFRKVCARVMARRNATGWEAMAAREYNRANNIFAATYAASGGYDAAAGLVWSNLRLRRYDAVVTFLDSVIMRDEHPMQYALLYLPAGDACLALGDRQRAADLYEKLASADVSQGLTEGALLRMAVLDTTFAGTARADTAAVEAAGQILLRYFRSDPPDSMRLLLLKTVPPLGPARIMAQYLRARLYIRIGRLEDAVSVLRDLDLWSLGDRYEALRLEALGETLFRLRRYQEAKAAFWLSLNVRGTPAAVYDVNTWVDRCDWMADHDAP
jgi:tetratricopeptide (TPR) repeat protein